MAGGSVPGPGRGDQPDLLHRLRPGCRRAGQRRLLPLPANVAAHLRGGSQSLCLPPLDPLAGAADRRRGCGPEHLMDPGDLRGHDPGTLHLLPAAAGRVPTALVHQRGLHPGPGLHALLYLVQLPLLLAGGSVEQPLHGGGSVLPVGAPDRLVPGGGDLGLRQQGDGAAPAAAGAAPGLGAGGFAAGLEGVGQLSGCAGRLNPLSPLSPLAPESVGSGVGIRHADRRGGGRASWRTSASPSTCARGPSRS